MKERLDSKIENEMIGVTIEVKGALLSQGFSITSQPDYHLNQVDFYDLKNPRRKLDSIGATIFALSSGLLFTSISRFFAMKLDYKTTFEPYELIGGLAGLLISLIIYLVGLALPNPKKDVMKKIEQHFRDNPPTRSTIGAKKQ